MENNLDLNRHEDIRRIAVFQIGTILAFDTPAGHFQYDMASDDEVAENNFLKLFRREEKRLAKLSLSLSRGEAMLTKPR
jgi:hypothetical protein